MKPTDDLFLLIKTMSKSEKRNFKLEGKKYGEDQKKYILLFDLIHDLPEYDESEVRTAVADFISERNFAASKNYLWNLLNDFLLRFHRKQNPHGECQAALERSILLRQRGLYKASLKELKMARKKAESLQFTDLKLLVNKAERDLIKRLKRKKISEEMGSLLKEWEELKRIESVERAQDELYDQLSILMRKDFDRPNEEIKQEVSVLFETGGLQDESLALSFRARRVQLQSLAFCHHFLQDYSAEFKAYADLLDIWEKNPKQIKIQPGNYRFALCNYLHSAFRNANYQRVSLVLNQLKDLPSENADAELEAFTVYSFYQLLLHLNEGNIAPALALAEEIEAGLQYYKGKLNDSVRLGFVMNLCWTYFFAEDHGKALRWVRVVVNGPRSEHRMDVQALSRALEVILLFELGEVELCISRSKANGQWLHAQDRLLDFERLILNTFRTMANHGKGKWKADIELLLDQLKSLKAFGNQSTGLEEVIMWCQAKLLQTKIGNILERKIQIE